MYSTYFEGATGEAGRPNESVNPSAPQGSRAHGDPWVHYVEDSRTRQTVIRFWFAHAPVEGTLAVDFEVLEAEVAWLDHKPLRLTFEVTVKLMLLVYFQEFMDDYYRGAVRTISFRQLHTGLERSVPYPQERISKLDIERRTN